MAGPQVAGGAEGQIVEGCALELGEGLGDGAVERQQRMAVLGTLRGRQRGRLVARQRAHDEYPGSVGLAHRYQAPPAAGVVEP
jgi:hypothetical protein